MKPPMREREPGATSRVIEAPLTDWITAFTKASSFGRVAASNHAALARLGPVDEGDRDRVDGDCGRCAVGLQRERLVRERQEERRALCGIPSELGADGARVRAEEQSGAGERALWSVVPRDAALLATTELVRVGDPLVVDREPVLDVEAERADAGGAVGIDGVRAIEAESVEDRVQVRFVDGVHGISSGR
jgi:hypothetical protein